MEPYLGFCQWKNTEGRSTSALSGAKIRPSKSAEIQPIVVSGPSGSGKSSIINRLFQEHPGAFVFSISHTTRAPEPGESNGKDYYFVSREQMETAINNGEFVEHTEFDGNLYGTSLKTVQEILKSGRICILDIEIESVKQVKKIENLNPRFIFIKPSSVEALEGRLIEENTESEELKIRLSKAAKDMSEVEENPSLFDHIVVSDDLDMAYKKFVSLLADELKKLPSTIDPTMVSKGEKCWNCVFCGCCTYPKNVII